MKVIIAGAGIGGLTAALCLHKSGHSVQVVEQSDTFTHVGAGLQCGANALKVLEYLGLLDTLKPYCVAPERVEFRDYSTGDCLSSMTLGAEYSARYGAPYWHVHRADLHKVLLQELNTLLPSALKMSSQIVGFNETSNNVTVQLADGRELIGDCLVGADGIKSVIRSKLLTSSPPRFTGHCAWRAIVPVERLPKEWMQKVVTNFVGPKKHAILYYVAGGKMANLVGVVESNIASNDSWVNKASWEELQRDFLGWHPMVQAIIQSVEKDQCYRWALYDQAPVNRWSSTKVTLLGDAAHASLPFMASGAAMAIEDARILDRAINSFAPVSAALKTYELSRIPRTRYVQNNSARMGRLYHLQNTVMRRVAFKGFSLAMRQRESVLPSYDANNVPLIKS